MLKAFFKKKEIFALALLAVYLPFCIFTWIAHAGEVSGAAGQLAGVSVSAYDWQQQTQKADTALREALPGAAALREGYAAAQELHGKRMYGSFTMMKDASGEVYYGAMTEGSVEDVAEYARRMSRLCSTAEANGVKVLFILPPTKVLYSATGIPAGTEHIHDVNDRMDALLLWLSYYQVPALDLRETMARSGLPVSELFYKNDHTWTPRAALCAADALVERLDADYDADLDPTGTYTGAASYASYTYPNVFFGAYGRAAGTAYAGTDDLTVLWPEFDTDFIWRDEEHDTERSGSFTEAFLSAEPLDGDDPYEDDLLDVYLDRIVTHDVIENRRSADSPTATVLRDAYFSPMACFLAPMFSSLDMYWCSSTHSDEDFEQIVRDCRTDYLFVEIYPYNLNSTSFSFFED